MIRLITLLSISMQLLWAQDQGPVFDTDYWATVRLAQVNFKENPKNDKAFILDTPQGWVRVSDLTAQLNPEALATLNTEEKLAKYQSLYSYIILAKALDAWSWNTKPYQYYQTQKNNDHNWKDHAPSELSDYALKFLLKEYAVHKQLDKAYKSDEELYQLLFEEVHAQTEAGFTFDIIAPDCANNNVSKLCLSLYKAELPETTLVFDQVPETLDKFKVVLSDKIQEWYVAAKQQALQLDKKRSDNYQALRRRAAFEEILESAKQIRLKKNETLLSKFYQVLADKVAVNIFANYCAFPSLICNEVDLRNLNLDLTNKNLSMIFGLKLGDKD